MGIASPRIIVVDDKPEEGEAIARALWRMGYASVFVEYGTRLIDGEYGPFTGVRLVFMDLELAGGGNIGDGTQAYADVEATINKLLEEDNGPWTLVMWTKHSDHGDDLMGHLMERLPETRQPVDHTVMDKEAFTDSDGIVNDDSQLQQRIHEILKHDSAFRCLLDWEAGVANSATRVTASLSDASRSLEGNASQNLGALLYELAKAEAGETLVQGFVTPLYRLLNALLADSLTTQAADEPTACNAEHLSSAQNADLTAWSSQINTMLHYDEGYQGACCPGAAYAVTEETTLPHPLDSHRDELLEKQFLFPNGAQNKADKETLAACQICLIEVTPPCDHNMNKTAWRRFIVAAQIPVDQLSKNKKDKMKKAANFKLTPDLRDESNTGFVFLLNGNLQVSLTTENIQDLLGNPVGRLKEQFMADVLDWLGGHISRTGIASL